MIINCRNSSYVIRLWLIIMFNITKQKGGIMLAKMIKKLTSTLTVVIALISSLGLPQNVFAAETQYFPVASSRVGPYSAMGTGYYGAQIDYMNYVNMTGGVNGVMLTGKNVKLSITLLKQLSVIRDF